MKILCTLLVLCNFGLNETSPTSNNNNEITNNSLIQDDQQCPEHWQLLNDKCVRILSEKASSFDEAITKCKATCKEEGSNLFEPQTAEEDQQVYERISNDNTTCDEYFIGIKAEDGM